MILVVSKDGQSQSCWQDVRMECATKSHPRFHWRRGSSGSGTRGPCFFASACSLALVRCERSLVPRVGSRYGVGHLVLLPHRTVFMLPESARELLVRLNPAMNRLRILASGE